MSENEYNSRRPIMCKAPWSQLTIGPTGDLKTCSVVPVNRTGAFIHEYDSLEDFYNGPILHDIRSALLSDQFHKLCRTCEKNRAANLPAHLDNYHFTHLPWTDENFNATEKKILTLEYTPSNLCFHACAYCGSLFSSKWLQYDKMLANRPGYEFRENSGVSSLCESSKNQQMSYNDIQKILNTLPSVKKLILKGGEPFADPTNTQILQEILSKGYEMTILIVSSWAKVSLEMWEIITGLAASKKVKLITMASIDGIEKTYEWIRDASWDETIDNIKRYNDITNEKITVSSTVSLYTFGTLQKTSNWLLNSNLTRQISHQYVIIPPYATAQLIPQNIIDKTIKEFTTSSEFLNNPNFYQNLDRLYKLQYTATQQDLSNALQWIEFINEIRGFNIFDHDEFLAQWAENISKNSG